MTTLLARLTGRRSRPASSTVVVFTRQGCGCCQKAIDLLKTYQPRYGFALETQDVDADPELAERHGAQVPVVSIDGKIRFRGVVNPVLLERLLAAGGPTD